jgi:hypothetical protein
MNMLSRGLKNVLVVVLSTIIALLLLVPFLFLVAGFLVLWVLGMPVTSKNTGAKYRWFKRIN